MSRPSARDRLYDAEWRELAQRIRDWAVENGVPCAECFRELKATETLDVHHIVPVREAPELRLDESNLQVLHHWCHRRLEQRQQTEKKQGYSDAVGPDGYPLDPLHPSNRGAKHD